MIQIALKVSIFFAGTMWVAAVVYLSFLWEAWVTRFSAQLVAVTSCRSLLSFLKINRTMRPLPTGKDSSLELMKLWLRHVMIQWRGLAVPWFSPFNNHVIHLHLESDFLTMFDLKTETVPYCILLDRYAASICIGEVLSWSICRIEERLERKRTTKRKSLCKACQLRAYDTQMC